ncbi:MAG: apolipoprotein N-acyltransferase [Micrococcales bacterium]|nr:apolipoprotein N-acyltransferase [Micrococcales bacterium]
MNGRDGTPIPTPGLAILAAVAGALVLRAAFPEPAVWWAAPVGVALTLAALRGRGTRSALILGFVGGLVFWLTLIDWIRYFLGEASALGFGLVLLVALASFMSLWGALGAALIAAVYRRAPTDPVWRVGVLPLVVAGLWTAREALSATIPWGGFSWGRVGFSQAGGALDGLFSWIGASGVSFVVVWLAALVVELVALRPSPLPRRTVERILDLGPVARGLPAVALVLVLVLVPAWPVATRGTAVVAGVQGDTKSSYADPPEFAGDILRAQTAETLALAGRRLDLVVWPEGGNDTDPLRDPEAAAVWSGIVDRLGAPLLGWAVTQRGSRFFNTSVMWSADGPGALYDKRHPVPFGEYVPARAVFHAVVPDLVDLLQREYTPGQASPVVPVGGGRRAGVFICFDIADDALTRQAVAGGAQFLITPSNNTDFGRYSDESVQQLQIARVRALESGRAIVSVSTVATTAVIRADGSIAARVPTWRPGRVVAEVPLARGTTPAMLAGGGVETGLGALGIAGWVAALLFSAAPRARRRSS